MYQYTECRISYQLVTFIHFQSRIFAAAKKINIVFITVQLLLKEMFLQVYLWECSSLQQLIR